jgi:hypothetical protein
MTGAEPQRPPRVMSFRPEPVRLAQGRLRGVEESLSYCQLQTGNWEMETRATGAASLQSRIWNLKSVGPWL